MMANTVNFRGDNALEFTGVYQKLMTGRAAWEVWADFVSMFADAISNVVDKLHFEVREDDFNKIRAKYSGAEYEHIQELCGITVKALDKNMWQDFLGSLYMALELGNHWKGQFFTPYCVTQVMADLVMGADFHKMVCDKGYITANDCACGAGATLIALAECACKELSVNHGLNWQNHVLFTAQDIDPIAAKMCYIQLSLLGCAGYVKIGDSLLNPIHAGDDNTNYWYTPMWFSEVWQYRRIWNSMDKIMNSAVKHKANTTKTTETLGKELPEQLTLF